jgi:peptidylprolyl isomerase
MTNALPARYFATRLSDSVARLNKWLFVGFLLFAWGSNWSSNSAWAQQVEQTQAPPDPSAEPGPPATTSLPGQASADQGAQDPGKLDTEAVLKMFREQATEEQLKYGMEVLAEFERAAEEFKSATLAMRTHHTRFVNGYTDDKARYKKLRNSTREAMNQCYRAALELIDVMPHPDAARFVATVLDFRVKQDIYNEETFEGAAKLLDAGVRLRYVVHAAARAGMTSGRFETSKQIYETLGEEDLDDIDRRLIAQFDEIKQQYETEQKLLEQDPDDLPTVKFITTRGEFTVELYPNEAPSTVSHFIRLCESGFYDGLDFFQVIDSLLALTGDPLGDGSSRPDRFLADEHGREVVRMPLRGSLVMAKIPIPGTGKFVPDSAGTQFAILFLPLPTIIEQQTVFGRVIDGMDVVGELRRVDPNKKKGKKEIIVPPDHIIECVVLNRPEKLPEPQYTEPQVPPSLMKSPGF